LEGLLLIYQASGNSSGLKTLASLAIEKDQNNIAFLCYMMCGDVENAIDLLIATDRIPEAAFLARTYLPSHISRVVKLWKESLENAGKKKVAESIANPTDFENLFPDIKYALTIEAGFNAKKEKGPVSALEYSEWKDLLDLDLVAGM
jgi:coatomer subunit beta'